MSISINLKEFLGLMNPIILVKSHIPLYRQLQPLHLHSLLYLEEERISFA